MGGEGTLPYQSGGRPVQTIKVEVIEGPDKGQLTTGSESVSIGTDASNDLVLTDGTVSRYHLQLTRQGGDILLVDHGSTNGTMLGGGRIERGQVYAGTVLRLGRSSIRVLDGDTVNIEALEDDHLGQMRGRTTVMRELMARVRKVSASDTSVLILGETGTGKEVVAKTIHGEGSRRDGPFETVDCGSMLPTLVASELFGDERGAFTGADVQHIGAFERADGGTLFLDEIGELPPSLQAALLGAIERRSFRRVGGKDKIDVDVRIICATNRDLRAEVNQNRFRADLYYRIAVVTLLLPPLRQRLEDIPLLVEHFLTQAGHQGPVDEVIRAPVMESFTQHGWPGNLRELRNTVEAALVMGASAIPTPGVPISAAEDEPQEDAPASDLLEPLLTLPYHDARARLLDEFEHRYLKTLFDRTGGNVSQAARDARIARSYLTKLVQKHGFRLERVAQAELEDE